MRIALALFALTLLASCVAPPGPRPAPPMARAPMPHPEPAPSSAALPVDWRDWPLTPGDWRYGRDQDGSSATFSGGIVVSCDNDRQVRIRLHGRGLAPVTLRTSTVSRVAAPVALGRPPVGAALAFGARDPLLDAIAFSRGRWTIEQPSTRPLVLPVYAEVARVIEDCRS